MRSDRSRAGILEAGSGRVWLPLLAVFAASAAIVLAATANGPWVGSDSVEYIGSARNLVSGKGLGLVAPSGRFLPLRLHPPLYPLLLAGLRVLGIDPLEGARWLNAILMGLAAMLLAAAAYRLTRNSLLATGVGLLLGSWAPMARLSSQVMSESLALALSIGFVVALVHAGATRRASQVVVAGVLAGLATMARYPAVSLIAAGGVYLTLFSLGRSWRDATSVALFLAVAGAPMAAWTMYLRLAYGAAPGALVWPSAGLWTELAAVRIAVADSIWHWIAIGMDVPYRLELFAAIGVAFGFVAVITVGIAWCRRQGRGGLCDGLLRTTVALTLVWAFYMGILAFSFVFRSPRPDLIERTLFPIPLSLTGASLAGVAFVLLSVWRWRWGVAALTGLVVAMLAWQIPSTAALVRSIGADPGGLAGRSWRASCTMDVLDELPPDTQMISNETAAVLLYRGVYPYPVPELESQERRPLDQAFGEGDSVAEALFRGGRAALVLFDSIRWGLEEIYHADAEARLQGMTHGLPVFAECWDGIVYYGG